MKKSIFKKYEKIIYKRAWEFSRKYGMEVGDLISEGYFLYRKARKDFDKSKGVSFSCYLYHRLRALQDYCQREKKHFNILASDNNEIVQEIITTSPERINGYDEINELLQLLSEDGQTLVTAILNGIISIVNISGRYFPMGKCNFARQISNEMGGTYESNKRLYNEIKLCWEKVQW